MFGANLNFQLYVDKLLTFDCIYIAAPKSKVTKKVAKKAAPKKVVAKKVVKKAAAKKKTTKSKGKK